MMGTTKLQPRRTFHAALIPLLAAAGALVVNCSSSSDNSTPTPGGGVQNMAGAQSIAGGGSGGAAPIAGGNAGGASGASLVSMPPNAEGKCALPFTTKHTDDMLCYCQPSTFAFCSDGCADLPIDPTHCGSCTTKCADTAACAAGVCGKAVTEFLPAVAGCGSIRLAISATALYWTEEMTGKVKSKPLAGGAETVIAGTESAPTLITTNGTAVYWLAKGAKLIKKAVGTTVTTVVPAQTGDIGGFTVSADGMTLYYAVGTTIYKVAAADGTGKAEVGHEDSGIPKALAVEGNVIAFPTDLNSDVDVMTIGATPAVCASPDSTTAVNKDCLRLSQSQMPNYESINVTGGIAYWSNVTAITSKSATDKNGNSLPVAEAENANTITAFSVSNGTVYFAGDDPDGYVYKAPLTGGAGATRIARKQTAVKSIVADANNAYWSTGACTIVTLPLK